MEEGFICGTFLAITLVVHEYQDWPSLTQETQGNPKRKKKVTSLLESVTPSNSTIIAMRFILVTPLGINLHAITHPLEAPFFVWTTL